MDIKFNMDIDLTSWANAIGYQIVGDMIIPKNAFMLRDFEECVGEYIAATLEGGTNSNAVTERFMVNDDEQAVLKEMLEEYDPLVLSSENSHENETIKYIIFELIERDITAIQVCDSWEEAFDAMYERFKAKAGDDMDDEFPQNIKQYVQANSYDEDSFGISKMAAWVNGNDNHDWYIRKAVISGSYLGIE